MASDDIRSAGDRRRGGDVERLGAAGAQRDRHLAPRTAASTSAGSPSRSAPRQSVAAPAERRRARRRRGRPAPPAAPASPRPRPAPSGWAKIEPMLARTAFGENGSAQPGPSDDRAAEQRVRRCGRSCRRCRGRRRRAGRRRARRRRSAQRCGQTAIARVPEPSVETAASSSGSTSSPPSPLPAAVSRKRGSAPAASPASTRSSPSVDEQPLALAVLALAQLADQLQLLVLGAFDHRCCRCVFWSAVSSPGTKKRAVIDGPPGKVECRLRLGGRTLPG